MSNQKRYTQRDVDVLAESARAFVAKEIGIDGDRLHAAGEPTNNGHLVPAGSDGTSARFLVAFKGYAGGEERPIGHERPTLEQIRACDAAVKLWLVEESPWALASTDPRTGEAR